MSGGNCMAPVKHDISHASLIAKGAADKIWGNLKKLVNSSVGYETKY